MSSRVSPIDKIRTEIDALFAAPEGDLSEVLEQVGRLGARLIIQSAVEAEVEEFLGRVRYQRASEVPEAREGSRNGFRPVTIKTTSGPVTIARPKLRGTTEAFASRLFGAGVTKTHALESLVIAGFVRGLSTRDVEATLADALGAEATLSKSTVSRVCAAIRTEFDTWSAAVWTSSCWTTCSWTPRCSRCTPGPGPNRCSPPGASTPPANPSVGLAPGGTESTDAWTAFLDELRSRGLRAPLLIISDGAGGLINAAESVFAASLRQRCLIHRGRNVLAKIPAGAQAEVKAAFWAIFGTDGLGIDPGPELVTAVQGRIDAFATKYSKLYPAAVKCLLTDRQQLTSYLRFPAEHQHRIRHSNFIERTFGETRRRVKVIGRLPGEASCLSLVWAVLDRASRGWRGFTVTSASTRALHDLRRTLLEPPIQLRPARATEPTAAPDTDTVGAVA